ncbi:MAG TPA: hypothetical protein VGM25_15480 [Caulobacteraceae bacterium]
MNTPAAPLSDPSAISPEPAAGPLPIPAERQLALLGELAELGMDVARAVAARARAAGPEEDLGALANAYARVSRAVRLTVMLQSKLMQAPRAAPEPEAPDEASERSEQHKFRVERIVERVLRTQHDDEDEIDRLSAEVAERLDDEDLYGEVLDRPLGELVALICRDVGLEPDWARMAQEAWAVEEIRSGAAGSPFAGLTHARPPPFTGEGDREAVERAHSCRSP